MSSGTLPSSFETNTLIKFCKSVPRIDKVQIIPSHTSESRRFRSPPKTTFTCSGTDWQTRKQCCNWALRSFEDAFMLSKCVFSRQSSISPIEAYKEARFCNSWSYFWLTNSGRNLRNEKRATHFRTRVRNHIMTKVFRMVLMEKSCHKVPVYLQHFISSSAHRQVIRFELSRYIIERLGGQLLEENDAVVFSVSNIRVKL